MRMRHIDPLSPLLSGFLFLIVAREEYHLCELSDSPLSALQPTYVIDDFQYLGKAIRRRRRESHRFQGFDVVDVVADIGDLPE